MNLITAFDNEYGIGTENNKLPWKLRDDLKWFKEITFGNVIIMGRKTFESIGCKPLSGRVNIVLSRSMKSFNIPGAAVFNNIDSLIKWCKKYRELSEIFVIGGREIYELFASKGVIKTIYASRVNGVYKDAVIKFPKDILHDFKEQYSIIFSKNFKLIVMVKK